MTQIETSSSFSRVDVASVDVPLRRSVARDRLGRRLLEGLGELNPDWMRLNVLGGVLLSRLSGQNARSSLAALSAELHAALRSVRLDVDQSHLARLIQRLRTLGLLAESTHDVELAVAPSVAATKVEAVAFIQTELRSALQAAASEDGGLMLRQLLATYADAAEIWRLDPVEARWPMLKAAATLSAAEREQLAAFLAGPAAGAASQLTDSLSLMLNNPIPADWLLRQAPHLVGRDVIIVTAEGLFNAAGGLGRVTQYHTAGMAALAGDRARICVYEPMYAYRSAPDGGSDLPRTDYAALARRLGATEPQHARSVSINVRGRDLPVEVYTSRLADGRVAYLLCDPTNYFARMLYAYNRFEQSSWAEFSEWLSEGAVTAIAAEMRERRALLGEAYKPPLISAHDAQTALVPEVKLRLDESGDSVLWEAREYFTTHTVLNRSGENLEAMGIPEWHKWAGDRMGWLDATSFGIRMADGRSAVSSGHAGEVEAIDPGFEVVAISNGTSIRDFEAALRAAETLDVEQPTAQEIERTKWAAKQELARALGISADECADFACRMLITYSGRMVPEKVSRGANGALVDTNVRELVSHGANVVIYGNVQPTSAESQRLYDDLARLSAELGAEGYAGRLLVRTGWDQRDQIELLKATDLQVQVSDSVRNSNFSFLDGKPVGTEAAGYTEAPIGRFGGLQMGPVELHGLLNRAGMLIDWSCPGSGSLLLAREPTSAAYLEEMLTAAHVFARDRELFYSMGQKAYALGAVYDAMLTAAEYLRQFSRTWDRPV